MIALLTLTQHGALFLATKTEGPLQQRARTVTALTWPLIVVLTFVSLIATLRVRPQMLTNYQEHLWGLIFPLLVVGSLAAMFFFRHVRDDKRAFLSSVGYITGMLGGAAFGLFPNVLPASTDPAFSLTVHNTIAPSYGLSVGLAWWCIGMVLVLGYFVFSYRLARGKVRLSTGEAD